MLLKTVEDEEAPCSYCHPSPEFITPSLPQDSSGPWPPFSSPGGVGDQRVALGSNPGGGGRGARI